MAVVAAAVVEAAASFEVLELRDPMHPSYRGKPDEFLVVAA